MITVEMSDDIRQYENKTIGPFTARQVATLVIGVVIAAPVALLLPINDWTNRLLIFALIMVPVAALAFMKTIGGPSEVIGIRMIYFYLLTPKKRKVEQKIDFYEEIKKRHEEEKQIKISKLSPADRHKYESIYGAPGKKKKVVYSNRKDMKVYG